MAKEYDYAFLIDKPLSYCRFLFHSLQRYQKLTRFEEMKYTAIAIASNLSEGTAQTINQMEQELFRKEKVVAKDEERFAQVKVGEEISADYLQQLEESFKNGEQ